MENSKKKIKSLRNIHKEIATEIKARPHMIPDDIVYQFLKTKAFQLNEPEKKKKILITSVLPNQHIRGQKDFFRSTSPMKKNSLSYKTSKTRKNKLEPDIDHYERKASEFSSISPIFKEYFESSRTPLPSNKNTEDYRMHYDRIFKGKISKKYLINYS